MFLNGRVGGKIFGDLYSIIYSMFVWRNYKDDCLMDLI